MSKSTPASGIMLPWFNMRLSDAAEGFAALAGKLRRRRRLFFLEQTDGAFSGAAGVCRVEAEGWRFSGRGMLRGAEVEFRLLPQHCISREIELPERAREFLDGVVRAQICRLTPWRAEEAAFGCATPETRGADRIAVAVVATRRAPLEGLLKLNADAVSVTVTPEGSDERITLMTHHAGAAKRLARWRFALSAWLAISLIAAAAAVSVDLTILAAMSERTDALTATLAARRAALLQRRHVSDDPAAEALDERKRSTPAVVVVLEALTRALPDNVYLTELRITSSKIEISGFATDAAGLIGEIEQSPHFSRATFTAPTTRIAAREAFRIEAQVTPLTKVSP